jgi:hypothetical protein
MSTKSYQPRTDEGKESFMNNLDNKLAAHGITLGVTPQEQTSVHNDALMFNYCMKTVVMFTTKKEQIIRFKDSMRDGPIGTPSNPLPVNPTLPPAPAVIVEPGIIPRINAFVQRIKHHANYTEDIGRDLGIVGSEVIFDIITMKPVLKLMKQANFIEIQWEKGHSDAIRIEVDRNDNAGWCFLAIDTVPNYSDTLVPTVAVIWKYRGMYLIKDELVGQWSDVTSIATGADLANIVK